MHGYVSPDGKIRPCCSADGESSVIGSLSTVGIVDAMSNGDAIRTIRRAMMAGERPAACRQCYANDDSGAPSYREWAVKSWGHLRDELEGKTSEDGGMHGFEARYMDIRPSNLCNLTCRTCGPSFSSALAAQARRTPEMDYDGPVMHGVDLDGRLGYMDQIMSQLDHVDEVYFAGGEPLLMDAHLEVLSSLASKGRTDVRVRYSTNMTMADRGGIMDLWKRFKNIRVVASIDSWGDRAEYIRPGCDWGQVESNMIAVRTHAPNVSLTINTVISVFNFLTMREFWLYLYDSGVLAGDSAGNSWTKLYYRPELRINNLPLDLRRQGILDIEALVDTLASTGRYHDSHMSGFRGYLDLWHHPDLDARPCVETIRRLDVANGSRCHDHLPELAGVLASNGYP